MTIEYFVMNIPGMLILVILGLFDCILLGELELKSEYCILNIFSGFVLMTVVRVLNKTKFTVLGLAIEALVLAVLFRDNDFLLNILTCLVLMIISYFLMSEKIARYSTAVIVVISAVIFWVYDSDSKVFVMSLIVGGIYSLGRILNKTIDYAYIVVVLMMMLAFLPVSEDPIEWTHIKKAIHTISEMANAIVDEANYALKGIFGSDNTYTGYSDIAGIGGGLSDRNVTQLIIQRNKRKDTLYLKGASFKGLTKKGARDKVEFAEDYNNWFVEFANTLINNKVSKEEATCFSRFEKAGMRYKYLRTKDIIAPATILKIDSKYKNGLKKKAKKGFFYEINYMVIDYGSPYYIKLIDNKNLNNTYYSYKEVKDYIMDVYHVNVEDFMSEEAYNDKVASLANDKKTEYLNADMGTKKIRKLANDITKDCDTDYEKAKAIESYLRGFTYDTSVDLRKSKNYIESFLFETKKGYCVHFASAMVLMLRESGVPARYVNGFLHDSGEELVMSNNAHAWVEAYIEGVGWMTFEPTSSKKDAEALKWGFTAGDDAGGKDYDKYFQERQDSDIVIDEDGNIIKDGVIVDDEKADVKEIFKVVLKYLMIVVIAFAVMLVVYKIAYLIWYALLTPEKKLYERVKKELKHIEKGVADDAERQMLKRNSVSIYDYLKHVNDDERREELREMFDLYYRVRFRGDKLDANAN